MAAKGQGVGSESGGCLAPNILLNFSAYTLYTASQSTCLVDRETWKF
jgi:hypothetical protein